MCTRSAERVARVVVCVREGVPHVVFPTRREWHRVLLLGGGAFHPVDFVWFGGAWGAALGAWAGAMPIPLDWDRPWQRWPVSCVLGTAMGAMAGSTVGWTWGLLKCVRGRDALVVESNEENKRRGTRRGKKKSE